MTYRRVQAQSNRVVAALASVFLLGVWVLTLWFGVVTSGHGHQHNPRTTDAIAGTDMFWELHDRHFPRHYLPNGRVTCSEERATKELEKLGLVIEP